MKSLKRKAELALEGSDRSDGALTHVRDYLDALNDRTLLAISDVELSIEIGALLRTLKELSDPGGSSPYKLQIVPRSYTGRPPNPAAKRMRGHSAMFAALYADRLLVGDPKMQKKEANSRAAESFGVAISEVYTARKTATYHELRDWNLKKSGTQITVK